MNEAETEQAIREYIPEIIHMSLATCVDNKPWVSEVHFSYDGDLNLYFRSRPSRRHSQEIAANPQVSGTIVTQHIPGHKGVRGVYFEGRAELLEGVEADHIANVTYQERFSPGPAIVEEAKEEDGHKFYKVTVTDYYVFDSRNIVPGQKYHLSWKG